MADGHPFLPRRAAGVILSHLRTETSVLVAGTRQTGKTALVSRLWSDLGGAASATMDDAGTLAAARRDPSGFVDGLGARAVVDEVQRAPELIPAILSESLRNPLPGRFLLTASTDPTPAGGDSIPKVPLRPLSQGEIRGRREGFIDWVFGPQAPEPEPAAPTRDEVIAAALVGGYPRVQALSPERRDAWFRVYVTALLERDIRDLAHLEGLAAMPQLLALVAGRSGRLLNAAALGRDLGLPNTTLRRYLALLDATYLVTRLPPWPVAARRRMVKAPKLFMCDSGLMAHLALVTEERLAQDAGLAAPLLETFALMELVKQAEWSPVPTRLFHCRTDAGHEVDLVLEREDGTIVGIDVRSTTSIGPSAFRGLETLRGIAGRRFVRGMVLHPGRGVSAFGPGLWAVPLSSVWTAGAG